MECSESRRPDFEAIRDRMKVPPTFLVGRKLHDPETLTAIGFGHMGIGRGALPNRLPVPQQAWLPQEA